MTLGFHLGGVFNSLPSRDARRSRRDVLLRRCIAESLRHPESMPAATAPPCPTRNP
jgi:hypothetical protein